MPSAPPARRGFRFGFAEAIGLGSSKANQGTLNAEVEWLDESIESAIPAALSRAQKAQQDPNFQPSWSDVHEMEELLQMQTAMDVADVRSASQETAPVRVADAVSWRGRKGRQRLQAAKTAKRVASRRQTT